ncbi:VanW family protein [Patescibacteria group bacterium]|nr:VanW family protein [Patescibacteria group bacterium]MBP9709593.1 VanW family protein [Patescibacteria group bacterium]
MVSPLKRHALVIGVLCIILIASLGLTGAWSYSQLQSDTILKGIIVGGTSIGGQTPVSAKNNLDQALQTQLNKNLEATLDTRVLNLGTHLGLIAYDVDSALIQATQIGRTGSWPKRLLAPVVARLKGYQLPVEATVEEAVLKTRVETALGDDIETARDARLIIQASTTSSAVFIEPEKAGQRLNIEQLAQDIEDKINSGSNQPLVLRTDTNPPSILATDLEPLVSQAQQWLEKPPFILQAEGKQWTITKTDLAPWITVTTGTKPLELTLSPIAVKERLRALAKDFLQPAKDGLIEVNASSTVIAFETPVQGLDVDVPKTVNNILLGWQNSSTTMDLVLSKVTPRILGDGERLGIEEVIGVGRSNFSGSPSNRRKNIALGAKKVHTTLLAPGQEFSLLTVLGEIDGANGWLPELVIKGNQTVPEFGGGLCQVGTTIFRAALASGLKITERRNHSYRVRYYEPAGTDATIYDPAPDFKFKNDMPTHALITTSIKGDEMAFTVWGTKDGRQIEQTKPIVYNIVAPPPKKIIETLDLPPGTEKCTESAHAGADAEFTYTVTHADGRVEKETFKSRYRPWQAVCLKGVTALTQPTPSGVDETGLNNPNL